jgi:hypothetical protein
MPLTKPISEADKRRFTPEAQSVFGIESAGGHWDAVGPLVNGDRAYGATQVMGKYIPIWTKQYYGTQLTPAQYLETPEAQIAVSNGVIGTYWRQAGQHTSDPYIRIRMTAAAWFAGPDDMLNYNSSKSDGYTTVAQYTQKVADDYVRIAKLTTSNNPFGVNTSGMIQPPLPVPEGKGNPPLGSGSTGKEEVPPPPPLPDVPDRPIDRENDGIPIPVPPPRGPARGTKARKPNAPGTFYFKKGRLFNRGRKSK